MGFDLRGLLQQYLGDGGVQSKDNVVNDFHHAAQNAPSDVVSQGLSETFRSDQTPPFGKMVGDLFNQADPQQRAGMLNQLLSGLSPTALRSLVSSGALSGLLDHSRGQPEVISPEQAQQVAPAQVQQIASQAEQHSPDIVEKMSGFYAEHPGLVKTLGGAVLSIALAKMAEKIRS